MQTLINAVLRDASHADHRAARTVLTDAFGDGAVARWAEPRPTSRLMLLREFFTELLAHAGTYGSIRLAVTDGAVTGVAVWYPYPLSATAVDVHDLGGGSGRLHCLEVALRQRHPGTPHHYLAYLAVSPDAHGRGIGTTLLRDQLAALHRARIPAYLEASDPRNRKLYGRLGFTDHGAPVTVDDCPPVWPMWWHPAAQA